ncbi:cell division cycle protein 20 homolog [Tubulanus polymorphus]|uniref:cell division cycle protein 20 homolog n=1 Tax=Tubulanus polymorphus TaxID=672921 RepID=UPI003DA5BE30
MAHFNFENDMSSLLKLDTPLTRGPMMRWQRKLHESSTNTSLNMSANNTSVGYNLRSPVKSNNMSVNKTPGGSKTPRKQGNSKTPSKGNKTPNKTPGNSGDRFIPSRRSSLYDVAHYKLVQQENEQNVDPEASSPSKQMYQRIMSNNLNGDSMNNKILSYKSKAPQPPEGCSNNMKVLYTSQTKTPQSTVKKSTRHIPQVPERILDAPDILDDYYLNLLDWSVNNHLAVALGNCVYLWNAGCGDITQLMSMDNNEDYVSSLSWIREGNFLAVGTSNNDVQIWDVANTKKLRTMGGHAGRVGSLSWNAHILSSGSRSGNIHNHDVRVAQHHISTMSSHTQEVCGLRWSPDGRYLASGGNDNILNIWTMGQNQPQHVFTDHLAAVKALAWCPWQPSLLASGGGTADRHIRFWNCNTGTNIQNVDTQSQVCSILWSKEHRELVSSHGFANNQLIIWKYPSLQKVTELTGHTSRVLHLAMSPDGSMVLSAAADETLRLWKCFSKDNHSKKTTKSSSDKKPSSLLSMRRL